MATDPHSGAPGGRLTEKPKVFGLFLFPALLCEAGIVLTLFLFFCFPVEGTSKTAFWLITGGGTIVSLLIGWWLYWQATRRSGSAAAATAPDA